MLEFLTYLVGPVLFIKEFKSYSKIQNRLFFLCFLWMLGCAYSNLWRGEDFFLGFKAVMIIFGMGCLLAFFFWMVKSDYRTVLWFMVGGGISSVIGLYAFQNGALLEMATKVGYTGGYIGDFLVEKQVYPILAACLFYSVLFPLFARGWIPWWVCIGGMFFCSFFILFQGGSRSGFGVYFLCALFTFALAYMKGTVRKVMSHSTLVFCMAPLVLLGVYVLYVYLAANMYLGEYEYQKYKAEMVENENASVLGSRDDLIRAWPFLRDHPLVGAGSSAYDRWGYMVKYIHRDTVRLPAHSFVVGSWVKDGIVGLVFWLYVLAVIFNFIRKQCLYFDRWSPFLLLNRVMLIWNVLFSPFSGRGNVCMAIAFSVLCLDRNFFDFVRMDVKQNEIDKGRI